MPRAYSLITFILTILVACAPTGPQSRQFYSTVEGVQMSIVASGELAEVRTVEQGTSVGQFRRGLLAEVEVAENVFCRTVKLISQSEETINDTTRATLVYAISNCRGY